MTGSAAKLSRLIEIAINAMDGTHNNDAVEIQWGEKINKFKKKKLLFLNYFENKCLCENL